MHSPTLPHVSGIGYPHASRIPCDIRKAQIRQQNRWLVGTYCPHTRKLSAFIAQRKQVSKRTALNPDFILFALAFAMLAVSVVVAATVSLLALPIPIQALPLFRRAKSSATYLSNAVAAANVLNTKNDWYDQSTGQWQGE